ncbi:TraR/DksA family transcriptional regulator [Pseudoduganella lurida]|uniref:TraR/DksA family transcriptional regulator n=1 Tax=Pseudoduganella lurida TaxID=1036180 RepID=A0A562RM58_9BURK|nr:TraR/DksA family transcriptional regulator [Pseudoduganella lurida]TWI70127.1 TraR/DksA family transcriptional regulator [Pseudoduganella lurida]
MNSLTQDQLAALQAALQQREATLLRGLADRGNGESGRTPAVEEVETSPADSASNRTLNQLEAEAEGHRQAQLSAVRHALARFDSGDYGACENCGEPIGFSRLEARPEARLCIACQTRMEGARR